MAAKLAGVQYRQQWGSGVNNSGGQKWPRRRLAYVGEIMHNLNEQLIAQVGKQRALTWWRDVGRTL